MTTSQPQETSQSPENGNDKPNEFGFAGAATAPQPDERSTGEGFGESIAVPAGDLTGAIVGAMEKNTDSDHNLDTDTEVDNDER